MKIYFSEENKKELQTYINDIVKRNWWSEGKYLNKFEELCDTYFNMNTVAVANGGAALYLLFKYINVKDKEVIIPGNTCIPTVSAAKMAGANIVYADCNKSDLCLSYDDMVKKVTSNTSAVVVVHIGGHIAFEIEKIANYCNKKNITLIEDCAHAHGAEWNGKKAGTWGLAGAYSFYATKTITTGEGGLIVTKRKDLYEWCKLQRNYGKKVVKKKVEYPLLDGFNFRISEFTAAIGIIQMKNLNYILSKKRALALKFDQIFENKVVLPQGMLSGYYKYIVFNQHLKEQTGKVYDLQDQVWYLHKRNKDKFQNCLWIAKNHNCVPIFTDWNHSDKSVEEISTIVLDNNKGKKSTTKRLDYTTIYPQNEGMNVKTSIDKAHSPLKMLAHPEVLYKLKKGEQVHPMHVRVGLTSGCNIRCKFCNFHSENETEFYDNYKFKDYIKTEEMISYLRDFVSEGGKAITFCGSGECTTHPGYIEICFAARKMGLEIGLITNGIKLNNHDMFNCISKTHTWLRVGLNAGSAKTYAKITNVDEKYYSYILENTRKLKKAGLKSDFKIGLNFVITKDNYLEIIQAAQQAKKFDADYIRFEPEFYTALAHSTIYKNIEEIGLLLNQAKKLENTNFEVSLPKLDRGPMDKTDHVEGHFSKCHYSSFVVALGADGCIYPCPQVHLGSKYRMGNAIKNGYSNWVKSGEREKWFEKHQNRSHFCKTCFYRPQNELLEWIKNEKLDLDAVLIEYNKKTPETLHKYFV